MRFIVLFILFASCSYADINKNILPYLPENSEVFSHKIHFTRSFQLHEFYWRLCQEAKNAVKEGGNSIKEIKSIVDSLEGVKYVLDDSIEETRAKGIFDMSRIKNIILDNERTLDLASLRLDFPIDGFKGKHEEIVTLHNYTDEKVGLFAITLYACFRKPVIFLVYDRITSELVGILWANPIPDIHIRDSKGMVKTVTIWYLNSICCAPHCVGLGIGKALMENVKADPGIKYVVFKTAPDNLGAQTLYHSSGYHLQSPPPNGVLDEGILDPDESTDYLWFYGESNKEGIKQYEILPSKSQ